MAKIKMKYRDFELEIEGDETFVEGKIKDFPSVLDKIISNGETIKHNMIEEQNTTAVQSQLEYKKITQKNINEFLREKNFSKDVDLVLGVAYYLNQYDGKEEFTTRDIKELLKKAKYSSDKNITALINNNIQKGYIEETGNKTDGFKNMIVIDAGIRCIESYVPKTENKKTVKKSSSNSGKLSENEKSIVESISKLDDYNIDDIEKIKTLKNQKQIVFGAVMLIDKIHQDFEFNSAILYEFIRKIGLNVDRNNISARLSESRSFYDQCENRMLKLSNYGRTQIEKLLSNEKQG